MKKHVSILLAAVLVLSLVPFSPLSTLEPLTTLFAKAESSTDSQGVTYTLSEDGTYYIVSNFDESVTEVTIPSTYNGLLVKEIGDDAFDYCTGLTSITIPDSVTTIGDFAFQSCTGLTSITIGDSVTTIGMKAFYDCDSLISITIPDSVTTIDDSFYHCDNLKSAIIGSSVNDISINPFQRCNSLENITVSSQNMVFHSQNNCIIETATKKLIAGCKTSIIPADGSVTTIGHYAFYACKELTSISIPGSVTTIDDYAFNSCDALTHITIPNSVTTIGYYAFSYCDSLTNISLPSSVIFIGSGAFNNCDNLVYNTYDNGLYLGDANNPYHAIVDAANNEITSIEINSKTKVVADYAFASCYELTSVTVPDSVISMDNAFIDCNNLQYNQYDNGLYLGNKNNPYHVIVGTINAEITSIEINSNTKVIANDAFYGCTKLTDVIIPDSVVTIGRWAFFKCNSLTSITIPDSVTIIGDWAIFYCSDLKSVFVSDSVTAIMEGAFSSCYNLEYIYCEASSKPDGWDEKWEGYGQNATVIWGNGLKNIEVDTNQAVAENTITHIQNANATISDLVNHLLPGIGKLKLGDSSFKHYVKVDYSSTYAILQSDSTYSNLTFIQNEAQLASTSAEDEYIVQYIEPDGEYYITTDIPDGWSNDITAYSLKSDGTLEEVPVQVNTYSGTVTGTFTRSGTFVFAENTESETETSEPETSYPESSEDTEETSSPIKDESSEAEEETDPTKTKINIKNNIALGRDYTTSLPYRQGGADTNWAYDASAPIAYPDEGGITLTDGIIANNGDYLNSAWCGLHSQTPDIIDNGYTYVNVDLGDNYDITQCRLYVPVKDYDTSTSITAPEHIIFYGSTDGKNYTELGEGKISNATSYTAVATLECNASVRYVEARIVSEKWNFVSEIAVVGTESSDIPSADESSAPEQDKEESSSAPIEDATSKPEETPPVEDTTPETIALGDINSNGEIDSLDYILLKRAYFGTFKLSETAQTAGDINKNGEIDSLDYILLKRAYFGTYKIK